MRSHASRAPIRRASSHCWIKVCKGSFWRTAAPATTPRPWSAQSSTHRAASAALPAVAVPRAYGYRAAREHVEIANAQTLCFGLIEDPEAVECVDAMLLVDGFDG